ncbi:MAG TPA: DUF29 domain-containing protein [Stellaceae bacterium]|nr:DUF29 domain-containing protein [Stellaceae bacterium]
MPRNAVAYDEDFFAWTQEQARLLREGEVAEIDLENLAEEIESVGRSDRREIRNRLIVLLAHLLKWQFQPKRRGNSWSVTLLEQRLQINSIIEDSPSLRPFFAEALAGAYKSARDVAARETRLKLGVFPPECPYTPEQILSEDFLPE